MILCLIVGLFALLRKRLVVSPGFVLAGSAARRFGITVLALTIPFVLIANVVARVVLPSELLQSRVAMSVFSNVLVAFVLLGLAYSFRYSNEGLEEVEEVEEGAPVSHGRCEKCGRPLSLPGPLCLKCLERQSR
jgi:hypothetical protein